jgi:hypothetical protein
MRPRQGGTSACVTANAPAELTARFPVVRGHDESGFAHAVEVWGLLAHAG